MSVKFGQYFCWILKNHYSKWFLNDLIGNFRKSFSAVKFHFSRLSVMECRESGAKGHALQISLSLFHSHFRSSHQISSAIIRHSFFRASSFSGRCFFFYLKKGFLEIKLFIYIQIHSFFIDYSKIIFSFKETKIPIILLSDILSFLDILESPAFWQNL